MGRWSGDGAKLLSQRRRKRTRSNSQKGLQEKFVLVARKSEIPVKVLEPRMESRRVAEGLWNLQPLRFSKFNCPGCSCTCQTKDSSAVSWVSGHLVQSFLWVFETVLKGDCRASIVLLQRSTGRLILNVLCGHLPISLPGCVLMAHSCLGKMEKNESQLHVWTLVSYPEPDPMEKQGLCITNLLDNCLEMQPCPVGYICAAAEPLLNWDRVWCENLASPLLRLWEVLSIHRPWVKSLWNAVFYLFETGTFIYVPLYRIRCKHFSIFVLIVTSFHGTKLR